MGGRAMTEQQQSRAARADWMTFLFSLLYFTSYMTRKSFGAIKLGLPEGYLTEAQVGLIGSALFLAYGIGQVVSGALGDRVDPRKLILCGLGTTAICNAAFPFVSYVPVLIVLWGINGFAQAMFWPPLVKLMLVYFKGERYTRASMYIVMSAQIALLVVFALSSLVIRLSAWRAIFAVATGLAVITGVSLVIGFRVLERRFPGAVTAAMEAGRVQKRASAEQSDKAKGGAGLWKITLSSGLLFVLGMTATQGFLRDGLEEWLSTYLRDTFSLSADLSTLLNVIMPLFAIICVRVTTRLYLKVFRDEIRQTFVVVLIAVSATTVLALVGHMSLLLSILMLMLTVGCVHSANTCLTCFLPARYEATGQVAIVAGLINGFTYVGSTPAATVLPLLFGHFSWRVALLSCAGVGALCLGCIALMRPIWRHWIAQQSAAVSDQQDQ